jgi:hypothetical protein
VPGGQVTRGRQMVSVIGSALLFLLLFVLLPELMISALLVLDIS